MTLLESRANDNDGPARSQPVLTASEIADLARVKRPVISMWRRRATLRGEYLPFPAPVAVAGGVEYFDAAEVVAWIGSTGRGNNVDFADDAAVAATPAGADLKVLTTLLTLRLLGGRELSDLSPDNMAELADEVDPDDSMLLTEVEELAGASVRYAPFVDALVEASFGAGDALDRLHATRVARSHEPGLTPSGMDLLAAVVDAASHALADDASVADAAGNPAGFVLDVMLRGRAGRTLVIDWADGRARLLRCTAALRGVAVATAGVGRSACVDLLSVVGMPPAEAIDAIDEVQLHTSARRSAVVVGPASLLCDRLDDPDLERVRSGILRSDHLRVAARLPRGLSPDAPRQMQAVWVFASRGATRLEQRTMALVDMSQAILTERALEGLAADVTAALTDPRRRSFAYGRLVRTSAVIADGEIVPVGSAPQRYPSPPRGERAVRVDELVAALQQPMSFDMPVRATAADDQAPRAATIGDLVATGRLELRSGSRIDRGSATTDGTIRIADPHANSEASFDPLVLAGQHDDPTRTEPGDVVFALSPRPRALVDTGGAVVAYPVRVLRPTEGSGVSPQLLAAEINRRNATDREWRGWRVPLPQDHAPLDAALAAIDAHRSLLRRHLDSLDALAGEVLDGVAEGQIDITTRQGV